MSTRKFFRRSKPKETEASQPQAHDIDSQIESVAALREPVRRSLYRFVVRAGSPVSRDQAANGVGVPWHVAKFHLDTLVAEGLLEVEYRRPPGRSGPGAGRPTKLYRRSSRELMVSLPERRYDLAGRIMAAAISASQSENVPVGEALHDAAATIGRSLADEARQRAGPRPAHKALMAAVQEVLDDYGYESREEGTATTLANCPFHVLAQDYTELVCGMNRDLLSGMLASLGSDVEARLEPAPGRCCVRLCEP